MLGNGFSWFCVLVFLFGKLGLNFRIYKCKGLRHGWLTKKKKKKLGMPRSVFSLKVSLDCSLTNDWQSFLSNFNFQICQTTEFLTNLTDNSIQNLWSIELTFLLKLKTSFLQFFQSSNNLKYTTQSHKYNWK